MSNTPAVDGMLPSMRTICGKPVFSEVINNLVEFSLDGGKNSKYSTLLHYKHVGIILIMNGIAYS